MISVIVIYIDTAATEIYTLSLHDALPILFALLPFYALHPAASTLLVLQCLLLGGAAIPLYRFAARRLPPATTSSCSTSIFRDRKSTRLNSSHVKISYAVFCLKKKKKRR